METENNKKEIKKGLLDYLVEYWIIVLIGIVFMYFVFSNNKEKKDIKINNNFTNIECISSNEAWDHIGENICVEYFVSNPYKSRKGNVFLNDRKDYKHGFTTVIFSKNIDDFEEDPYSEYGHNKIRVKGLIKMYRGHPEIIANYESQIEKK